MICENIVIIITLRVTEKLHHSFIISDFGIAVQLRYVYVIFQLSSLFILVKIIFKKVSRPKNKS